MESLEIIMELVQLGLQKSGAYFTYKLPVQRGIRGKSKGKVDELMIIGIPYKNMERYCEQHNYIITNKALYIGDMDNPVLINDGTCYRRIDELLEGKEK